MVELFFIGFFIVSSFIRSAAWFIFYAVTFLCAQSFVVASFDAVST